MKSRTVMELMPDGHIAVTKQVRRADGGTAADRRAARKARMNGAEPNPWRKAERKIFRSTVPAEYKFGENITLLPFGSEDIVEQQQHNNFVSATSVAFAEGVGAVINANNDAFARDSKRCLMPKVKKVVIVYEGGMVEEL